MHYFNFEYLITIQISSDYDSSLNSNDGFYKKEKYEVFPLLKWKSDYDPIVKAVVEGLGLIEMVFGRTKP